MAYEDEAWPDPQYEREAFEARLDGYVRSQTQAATAQGRAVTNLMAENLLDSAVSRAADAIREHLPGAEYLIDHPEFAERFRQGLAQCDPSNWRNPMFLAQVAGAIAPQLSASSGRARTVSQSRGSDQRQYSDIDRMAAERMGCSVEEAAALDDPTGERWRQVRARQQQQRSRNGRR